MSVGFASRGGPRSRGGPGRPTSGRPVSEQSALPIEPHPPAPPAAVSLLAQARHGLAEAGGESAPAPRFAAAYLSALRAAAAVLVARGRPHRGRARPESVWTLLESSAPELSQWAAFFAANSRKQAAAQAGNTRRVSSASAEEMAVRAGEFVALAHRAVHGVPDTQGERSAWCGARSRPRLRRTT